MNCRYCDRGIPPEAVFCPYCGRRQEAPPRAPKKRGNGQGSVYKLHNGKYVAIVTTGYYRDEKGVKRRKTRSKTFVKKSDAIAALPALTAAPAEPEEKKKAPITFSELYEKWLPTHRAGKDTINCYKAAYKHFAPVHDLPMPDIDVDDLQECLDDCGHGKRTRENMRALAGLLYKYGIPRHVIPDNLNLAPFLIVSGESAAHRSSFSEEQLTKISKGIGKVPYADYVYCMCYLGFRPSEFLALDCRSYNAEGKYFTGGGKTAAGRNRAVTVSPKIQKYVDAAIGGRAEGAVFADADGKPMSLRDFTEDCFYPALEQCGIDNPVIEIAGGVKRHTYTPHSCRHTFATLMKNVAGSDKDKLALIGHTSTEMLRYYQDAPVEDLRKITDLI